MSVMYLLVPLALLVVALAVAAYVWAARKGQFDDLKTPAMRMLHDDETGVERRTSNVERQTSNVERQTSNVERQTSNVDPTDRHAPEE